MRYLPDGAPDTSFGAGGLAAAGTGVEDIGNQLIQLPNGKLVVAGLTIDALGAKDFLLARFQPDGALDTSFGAAGFLQTDFGDVHDTCTAVAIAGQDLILASGWAFTTPGQPFDFALARYIAATPVDLLRFEVEWREPARDD